MSTTHEPHIVQHDHARLLWSLIRDVTDYAVLLLDPEGRVISWNRGSDLIKGYQADEIIDRDFACFYPLDDIVAGKPAQHLAIAAATGRFEEIGERVRKDGSRFLASVLIVAVPGTEGLPRGYGKIVRDITQRLTAEELNKANAARLRSLIDTMFDTIHDGLLTIDRRGLVQSYNKGCTELFGYTPDEVIGHRINMLMPEPHRSEHDGYVSAFLDTGVPKVIGIGREVMGQRKDGTTFPLELTVGESRDGGDHAFVGIVRDVTERREADVAREQLRQAQKMEAVGQLTGGLAHDFNNLLAIIIGNLDMLHELRREDAVAGELVRDALDAALRGADLTRRLLAFARRQPLKPERSDINSVIGGIMKLLTRTLGENITIQLQLDAAAWPVLIDRAQFEAAIANITTNARDAMPRGGTLLISTHNGRLDESHVATHGDVVAGDYVVIEISDSGSGMPPEILTRVFEPFFTTKEIGKGTGLGLSMVFGFIKQLGGHITVYSEVAKGTTFRLYLPRQPDLDPTSRQIPPEPATRGGDETILVVEDNHGLRRIVVRQLGEAGYRVLEAPDADAAMTIIEGAEPIDLLLSDVVMPGAMDGRDLARAAVIRRPGLKVLLTSGFPNARYASALAPGSRLLSKPYRRDELRRAVREAIEGTEPDGAPLRH